MWVTRSRALVVTSRLLSPPEKEGMMTAATAAKRMRTTMSSKTVKPAVLPGRNVGVFTVSAFDAICSVTEEVIISMLAGRTILIFSPPGISGDSCLVQIRTAPVVYPGILYKGAQPFGCCRIASDVEAEQSQSPL